MEEVLPPQTQDGAAYEPPRVRQFTVFMENKVGRLQQLVRGHEEAGGKIVALSVQSQSDTSLVRLICANPDMGRDVLQREGFSFTEQDVLVVEVPARSKHPLTAVCRRPSWRRKSTSTTPTPCCCARRPGHRAVCGRSHACCTAVHSQAVHVDRGKRFAEMTGGRLLK